MEKWKEPLGQIVTLKATIFLKATKKEALYFIKSYFLDYYLIIDIS